MGQRIIGLTGGIATGKTTVSRYLAERHQLPILDADVYSRQAVALGSPILAAIAQRYGPDILLPDGNLDRRQLGAIVFQIPAEKQWLEQQIHPFVRDRFAQAMAQLPPEQTVVHAIPLLFEAKLEGQVSEIWVVTCDPQQQLERVMGRDRLSRDQAQARIDSQMSLTEKVALADVVINNSGTLVELYGRVDKAFSDLG
ncbi:MAG: dephospho-CoA kinase [Cyanobacteria bacterium J06635_15]